MKWFQHMTDAHDDEFISEVMERFGPEGYTAWFVTAELVGKVIKVVPTPGKEPGYAVNCRLVAAPNFFSQASKISPNKLEQILRFFAQRRKLHFAKVGKKNDERWIVEWPKLLDFKDNATSDLISRFGKSLGSTLPSDFRVTSGLQSNGIGLYNTNTIDQEQGESVRGGGGDSEALWAYSVARAFARFCRSPGIRAMQRAILDLLRQEVPLKLIEEAPMNPEYQKMGFWRIMNSLESFSRANQKGVMNAGAAEVVRKFALPSGELDRQVQERIQSRERAETSLPDTAGSGGEAPRGATGPDGEHTV